MNGTITKYRKKDGRVSWGYYFKAGDGQFTKSGYATKGDAAQALQGAIRTEQGLPPVGHEAKPDASPANKGDRRTVADYLNCWLDEHASLRCQETTMEDYRRLAKYLIHHLGHIRMCDLQTAIIQEMVNRLQRHGGMKTAQFPEGRPLGVRRTHAIASLLHTVLTDALRLGCMAVHPMGSRKVRLAKRVKQEPPVLDEGMLGQLYAAARGVRAYPYIITAASSGARRGELCALTWEDVDFDIRSLSVTKSLAQTRAKGLFLKSTKSAKPRYFPLDEFALEVLAEHREEQARDKARFGRDYRHDLDLVFCQPNGYYWSPNNIGLRVSELLKKAGLASFSPHSLRHSHASIQLSKGTPMTVVSQRLGHANPTSRTASTLTRYLRTCGRRQRRGTTRRRT